MSNPQVIKLFKLAKDVKAIRDEGIIAIQDRSHRFMFKGMMTTFEASWNAFNTLWEELVVVGLPPDLDPKLEDTVKRYRFECLAFLEQIKHEESEEQLERSRAATSNGNSSGVVSVTSSRLRLPTIELEIFDGSMANWTSWRDSFVEFVDKDENIPDIEKFHLLVKHLKGPPLQLVKSAPSLHADYKLAWETLMERYNSTRLIAGSCIDSIIDFDSLHSNKLSELERFLYHMRGAVDHYQNLPVPDKVDFLLLHMILRHLDRETKAIFEDKYRDIEYPKVENLLTFVQEKVKAGTICANSKTNFPSSRHVPNPPLRTPGAYQSRSSYVTLARAPQTPSAEQMTCFVCQEPHKIWNCPTYSKATPSHREQVLLKDFKGCRNCLNPKHRTLDCPSENRCRACSARHHTSLHFPRGGKSRHERVNILQSGNHNNASSAPSSELPSSSCNCAEDVRLETSSVLLGTLCGRILGVDGQWHSLRMILDLGSQHSFIVKRVADILGYDYTHKQFNVRGIGGCSVDAHYTIPCHLSPPVGQNQVILSTEAVVVPFITGPLPQLPVSPTTRELYHGYDLADPENWWKPGPIDMLLGADIGTELITSAPLQVKSGFPSLINTLFGHVLIGSLPTTRQTQSSIACFSAEESLPAIMNRFWESEECTDPPPGGVSDCEEHFVKTHFRLPSGRFGVALPFRGIDPPILGPSKENALMRLLALERKFKRNPEIRASYTACIEDFLETGHIIKSDRTGRYYVPHFAVFRQTNSGLKARVVFDFAMKTSKGSLNDHLMVGDKLHQDLTTILLNFRRHRVVFTTDIVKMYRQIRMTEEDQQYLHVLWRDPTSNEVEDYQITVLAFGLTSAPYIALRVMKELVNLYRIQYPLAAEVMEEDRYVDDIISGGDTLEETRERKNQVEGLLAQGEFELSKWTTNTPQLLEGQGREEEVEFSYEDPQHPSPTIKILGLVWDPKGGSDHFTYRVTSTAETITKRTILSAIAKLHDPVGYVSPVIFWAKCIMQKTWSLSVGWDQDLPPDLVAEWQVFVMELPALETLKIPRYLSTRPNSRCGLVGFSDASKKGYAAALYLVVYKPPNYVPNLLCSKTKLAPLREITIPRLELQGAALLVKLFNSVHQFIKNLHITSYSFFTDSSIVLGWLRMDPNKLNVYVSNRISFIKHSSDVKWWKHVRTKDNPSDLGSRGTLPTQLIQNDLWWHGPSWLLEPEADWPTSHLDLPEGELPEVKPSNSGFVGLLKEENSLIDSLTDRCSSYSRCVNILAYVLRFWNRCRKGKQYSGYLTITEAREAELILLKLCQKQYLPNLLNTSQVPKSFHSLAIFMDKNGLLRVGGRLKHSRLPYAHKHPILLPRRSPLTTLLVDHFHRLMLHCGTAAIQASIQERFWIPSLKALLKCRKLKCSVCIRTIRHIAAPFMGDLPTSRFEEIRPFYETGVDFGGPFLCKDSARRNASYHKAYLALFICFSTKAVHLELVDSLSSESFLDALERFVSRRGRPYRITSDNGTNFHGANNYLREVGKWLREEGTKKQLTEFATAKGIIWSFIPSRSPHFGGLWEAGIKVTKHLLMKYFGKHKFSFLELNTALCRIEAILNSRPLYPLSSDPNDLSPLTPGHFLTGGSLTTVPEVPLIDRADNRLSRWQFVRKCTQLFWRRWRVEYLHILQGRVKWTQFTPNLEVGDLVLLKESPSHKLSNYEWPLGRIVQVFPGEDGVVRVVNVKTSEGIFKRPVIHLISLSALTRDPRFK